LSPGYFPDTPFHARCIGRPNRKGTLVDSIEVSRRALVRAADDFSSLADVFGWLDEMLAVIGNVADSGQLPPSGRLYRIKKLTDCARYLAADWQEMAYGMAEAHNDNPDAAQHG
jgi:hypothetical protein